MDQETIRAQIAELAAFPQRLRALVAGLSDAELRFRPAEGAWSVVENVGHLIDIDVLMRGRITKIISVEGAALSMLDVDAEVIARGYQSKQATMLLHSFAEQRAEMVEQLRVLRPDALERAGSHPTRGRMSIAEIVGLLVRHDQAHVVQIEETLAAARR